jgi:hypothetical protein
MALFVAALTLVVLFFIQRGLMQAYDTPNSTLGDQESYLQMALKIKVGWGFTNRNHRPLLPLLLQPIAANRWDFFTQAKLVNLGIGTLGVVLMFVLGRRLVGKGPSLLAAAALALNGWYTAYAARPEPQTVLTVLFLAAWATWVLGFSNPRWWWLAGPLAGLAVMAKGTGMVFLAAFLVVPLLRWGPRGLLKPWPWLLVGLMLLTASPLLADRAREFGSPFYDYNSTTVMWYDTWQDRKESPKGDHGSFQAYLETHRPAQMVERLVGGALKMPIILRQTVALDLLSSVELGLAFVTVALALLALLARLWRYGTKTAPPISSLDTDMAWTALAIIVPVYVFFSWYMPIVASPRFEQPIVPIVYLIVVSLAWRGLVLLLTPRIAPAAAIVVGALAVVGLWQGTWVMPGEIAAHDRQVNEAEVAVLEYLIQVDRPESEILWGPGEDLFTWPFYGLFQAKGIPANVKTWQQMRDLEQERGISHIVLGFEMVEQRPEMLGSHFRVIDRKVAFETEPPGWKLVFAYPGLPCRFCVFRVTSPSTS